MPNPEEHANYYGARAPEYDASVGYGTDRVEAGLAPLKNQLRATLAGYDVLEVACGTGYWTQAVAQTASSVLAVDLDQTSLALAKARLAAKDTVRFQRANAYSLDEVEGRFTAAFGMFWWSHVPTAQLTTFLSTLHSKLQSGAPVVFVDQLPYKHPGSRRFDDEGNSVEQRTLFSGATYEVVKNFPSELEILEVLTGFAQEPTYSEGPDDRWWMISYRAV